ncbi:hypothetical protein [Sphingobium abikonense]|uniref:hypothetical protein n=1 Tax=Sphingobium abikonense TaxID=86193 RepID=UPI00351347EB
MVASFTEQLADWLSDVPVGKEKVFGSIRFGSEPSAAGLHFADKMVAVLNEAEEVVASEIQSDILAIGIANDQANEGLRSDGRLDDAAADAQPVGELADHDFLHCTILRGESALATIAEGGAADSRSVNNRRRATGGPRA